MRVFVLGPWSLSERGRRASVTPTWCVACAFLVRLSLLPERRRLGVQWSSPRRAQFVRVSLATAVACRVECDGAALVAIGCQEALCDLRTVARL